MAERRHAAGIHCERQLATVPTFIVSARRSEDSIRFIR